MKKKFTKLTAALALLALFILPLTGWGQQNVTLWSEDFSSYSSGDVPTGGTYSYACTDGGGGGTTKIYNEALATGTAPEILVAKAKSDGTDGGTFTAVIPLDNIEGTLTLTYYQNANSLSVSSPTTGISGGQDLKPSSAGQQTTTFTGITTSMTSITIVFQATASKNVRLDNIVLTGTTAGGSNPPTPTTYAVTFDAGDGTFVGNDDFPTTNNTNVAAGNHTLPSAEPAEGYTFNGWLATGITTPVTGSYPISSDIDFTASYSQNSGSTTVTTVTYDFTSVDNFLTDYPGTTHPTAGTNISDFYSLSGEHFVANGSDNYKFHTSNYFFLGKKNATLQLPAFEFDVEKIEIVGKSGASGSVTQNIYVENTAVSTETTGATGTNTYVIADGHQTAGTVYTLKVTSAHNTQITQIKVYEKVDTGEPSIAGTAPAALNYNATSGLIGYTITNEVEGGIVSASVPSGSWITVPSGTISDNPFTFTCSTNPNYLTRTETVTLTYTYNTDQTKTTEVTVTQNGNPNGVGSQSYPLTVAQARALIDELPTGTSSESVYVTGIVSSIVEAWSSTHSNISFNFSEDGATTSNQLEAYRCVSTTGNDASTVGSGDVVIVYGTLKLYNSTTYEFNSGCQLVSLEHPAVTDPTITVTPLTLSSFTYEVGQGPSDAQTITVSGSNLTDDITLSLTDGQNSAFELSTSENGEYSNTITLTQTDGTVEVTTIYVRMKESLEILANGYDDDITIASENATSITINLTGTVTAPEAPHVTWDLTIASYDEVTDPDVVTWSSDYATMTNVTGESSTAASSYIGGGTNNNNTCTHTRFYQGQVLTITPSTGYNITSIVITATDNTYAGYYNTNATWSNATVSVTNAIVTATPTNGNTAVSVTFGKATRATQVKVYYTASTATAHDVTIDDELENGTITANPASAIVGTTITLTVTPDQGYYLADNNIVTEPTLTLTKTDDNTFTFTMPDEDVLVMAEFTAIPMKGYWYSVNGVDGDVVEVAEGTEITLAEGANLNADFTFAGWTTDPNDVSNRLTAGSQFTMDDDYEFYAVYAHTTGAASGAKDGASYVKVTSTDDLEDGNYLIVYEDGAVAFDGSLETLDAENNTIEVEIENEAIASTSDTDASVFTITAKDGGYSIKSASNLYIGHSGNKNALKTSATDDYTNSIAFDVNGLSISCNNYNLRFNDATNQNRFRYFGSGQNAIQLYKYTAGGTPTPQPTTAYYTRVFLNETVEDNIEIVGPSIIPSGEMLDMGEEYILLNDDPANLIIEDGGQLYTAGVIEATIQKNISGYTTIGSDTETADGWYFISSPLNCDTEGINPATATDEIKNMTSGDYDLYLYDPNANMEWVNFKGDNGNFGLINGHGYLYANANDVTLEFAGSLNHFDAESFSSLEQGYNLIGNPYAYNAYPSMSYYKMNEDHTAVTAEPSSDPIEPCTGIIVDNTDGDAATFAFTKNDPTDGAVNGNVQLALVQEVTNRGNNSSVTLDNAIVSFKEGSKLGKFYFGQSNANIYIPQNGKDYAIVSAEAQGEMPVNFKAKENGTYTLNVNADNVEMNYLHLIDNLTGNDVDLLATPNYTFEARKSDYASRFRLVFNANNADNNDNFAFVSNGQIILSNADANTTVQVIDALGRIIVSTNATQRVATDGMTAGVYVVRLINGNDVKTQKIVVK